MTWKSIKPVEWFPPSVCTYLKQTHTIILLLLTSTSFEAIGEWNAEMGGRKRRKGSSEGSEFLTQALKATCSSPPSPHFGTSSLLHLGVRGDKYCQVPDSSVQQPARASSQGRGREPTAADVGGRLQEGPSMARQLNGPWESRNKSDYRCCHPKCCSQTQQNDTRAYCAQDTLLGEEATLSSLPTKKVLKSYPIMQCAARSLNIKMLHGGITGFHRPFQTHLPGSPGGKTIVLPVHVSQYTSAEQRTCVIFCRWFLPLSGKSLSKKMKFQKSTVCCVLSLQSYGASGWIKESAPLRVTKFGICDIKRNFQELR